MSKYNKGWSSLVGAIVGLVVAYGLISAGTGDAIMTAVVALIPAATSIFATVIGPKNTD